MNILQKTSAVTIFFMLAGCQQAPPPSTTVVTPPATTSTEQTTTTNTETKKTMPPATNPDGTVVPEEHVLSLPVVTQSLECLGPAHRRLLLVFGLTAAVTTTT